MTTEVMGVIKYGFQGSEYKTVKGETVRIL